MDDQTPIYSALCRYRDEECLRLHMPGHVGGRGMNDGLRQMAELDVTEIEGMDDFHLPQGIIAASQQLLAKAVGAEESFYLVNGASSGIQALFMSMLNEGEAVLIPRNCHRSFYGGLVLSGAMPVYIPSRIENELGMELAVDETDIEICLGQYPEVKAVFITSPSYLGTGSDIESIAAAAQKYNKMVLVDEAHGGHFPFHEDYPLPALAQGAAASVNGLHKTWPVLNQGGCLHIHKGFHEKERLRQAVSLLTTTSPSYPLLASMELARMYMEQNGRQHLEQALQWSRSCQQKINQIKGLRCHNEELKGRSGVKGVDPLKMVITMPGLPLSGYQMGHILRTKYHIQLEMESRHLILAMFSLLHDRSDWERLYLALREIAADYKSDGEKKMHMEPLPVPQVILSPRKAFQSAKRQVILRDSLNLISGEMVAVYPPGIPCLLPGERITAEILDYLHYVIKSGARIQGPKEPDLKNILVID